MSCFEDEVSRVTDLIQMMSNSITLSAIGVYTLDNTY